MVNTGHKWTNQEETDLITMDREDFLTRYPDISDDAARLRAGKIAKKKAIFVEPVVPTGTLDILPLPHKYVPSRTTESFRTVFLGDTHGIFVDAGAFHSVLDFMHEWKPQIVYLMGDIIDFYDVSSFKKDPNRRIVLGQEIEFTIENILGPVRRSAPRADIIYLQGNHEDRLRRYLWTRAPELASLPTLDIRSLFRLNKLRIEYEEESATLANLEILHGHMTAKHSGWTARAMVDDYQQNVIVGHTHKLGAYYRTDRFHTLVGYENGCLCKFEMEYMKGISNWQHGFSYGYVGNGLPQLTQVVIQSDSLFSVEGKDYLYNAL